VLAEGVAEAVTMTKTAIIATGSKNNTTSSKPPQQLDSHLTDSKKVIRAEFAKLQISPIQRGMAATRFADTAEIQPIWILS
jgi:hypothetical protein